MSVVLQRPLRGSRISSFYPVKSLPSLASLDSAFQLQEYISLLIRLDVHDVDTIVSVPGKTSGKERHEGHSGEELKGEEKEAEKEHKSEIAVDESCWIYEQLRRLAQDLSHPLITMLQQECTRASCPEMKAGEWLYLCVAHGNDGAMEQCCAIDYILHTLDSATALLNSPRAFPSRLSIPQSSHRHFSSLARRLGRIFAHAYFHHREAFEQAEAESSLYARFLSLTSKFELVPAEFLVIPTPPSDGGDRGRDIDVEPPRLLAASVDHQRDTQPVQDHQRVELGSDLGVGEWEKTDERGKSPPGLGTNSPGGDQSPRKYGRNRTDTMVYTEAFNVVEELPKRDGLDGGREGNPMDATDGIATENLLDASEVSEPQIIIDEVEASSIEAAAPKADNSQQGSIEPSLHAETSRTPADGPEPSTHTSATDAPAEEASAPEPPVISASTASESTVEDVDSHVLEVKEAPKAEPDYIPEEPSSDVPRSSEAEIPPSTDSTPADAAPADTAPSSENPAIDEESDEGPAHVPADIPEIISSEAPGPSVSDDFMPEHKTEHAPSEPITEEVAEITPEPSLEEGKELDFSS